MTEGTKHSERHLLLQDGIFVNPLSGKRQRIEEIRAEQAKRLKEPGLPDRQKQALNAKATQRFGQEVAFGVDSFETLQENTVVPILIKFFHAHAPSNPTMQDLRRSLSGWYIQERVHFARFWVVDKPDHGCHINPFLEESVTPVPPE